MVNDHVQTSLKAQYDAQNGFLRLFHAILAMIGKRRNLLETKACDKQTNVEKYVCLCVTERSTHTKRHFLALLLVILDTAQKI